MLTGVQINVLSQPVQIKNMTGKIDYDCQAHLVESWFVYQPGSPPAHFAAQNPVQEKSDGQGCQVYQNLLDIIREAEVEDDRK